MNFIQTNQNAGDVVNAIRPALFQTGDFTLASGAKSRWKLECDALTQADWEGLAAIAMEHLPPFRAVFGVPRGGLPLARALDQHVAMSGPVLIVDDVWTTGGSIKKFIKEWEFNDYIGLVAFARNPVESWVTALFQMPVKK